jgi:hypothetical protein
VSDGEPGQMTGRRRWPRRSAVSSPCARDRHLLPGRRKVQTWNPRNRIDAAALGRKAQSDNAALFAANTLPIVDDRGREGCLTALRTVRAVFPHTDLQSVVPHRENPATHELCKASSPSCAKRPWPVLICAMAFFDAVTSADPMRCVRTETSAHNQDGRFRHSAPRSSPFGHCRCSMCFGPFITHPPSCPPSLSPVLLPAPLAAHRRCSVGSEEARSIALALASVRRPNWTCSFRASSFHERALAA